MEQLMLECDVFMKRLDRICSLNKPPKDYIGLVSTRLIENHNKQNAFSHQQMRLYNSREKLQSQSKPFVGSAYSVELLKEKSGEKERSQKGNLEQGFQMVSSKEFEIMKEKQQSAESERKNQLHSSPITNRYKQISQREQQQQNEFEGQYISTPEENELRKRASRTQSEGKQEQGQAAWIETNKNNLALNYNQNGNGQAFREMNNNIAEQYTQPSSNRGEQLQPLTRQTEGLQEGGQNQSNREQRVDKDYLSHQSQVQGNIAIYENIKKMEQSEERIRSKTERNYWNRLERVNNSSKKEAGYLNVKQEALIVKKEEGQEQQEDFFIENYNNHQSHLQQSVREWSDIEVQQLAIVLNNEPILVENPQLSFQKIAMAFNYAISQLEKNKNNNQKLPKRTQEEIIAKLRADAKVVFTNERKKHDSIYKNLMEISRTTR